jgi:hypothetical protein
LFENHRYNQLKSRFEKMMKMMKFQQTTDIAISPQAASYILHVYPQKITSLICRGILRPVRMANGAMWVRLDDVHRVADDISARSRRLTIRRLRRAMKPPARRRPRNLAHHTFDFAGEVANW